jgi:hypothetical protein
MTNEDVRKLLGGYATNTLTESERKALFDAALEDQELFNALQDEQALRELLADPASRQQIRGALLKPAGEKRLPWTRPWMWGSAAGAIAAAVLIVAVIQRSAPQTETLRVESSQESAKAVLPEPASNAVKEPRESPAPPPAPRFIGPAVTAERAERAAPVDTPAAPPPAAMPATPPSVTVPDQIISQASEQVQLAPAKTDGQLQNQAPPAGVTKQFLGGFGGAIPNYNGPLVRYSLLKRDANGVDSTLPSGEQLKPGDAIRLRVTPGAPGYLALYQLDKSGESRRVFPATDVAIPVLANISYTMPAGPILVTDTDAGLRIVLAPAPLSGGTPSKVAPQAASAMKAQSLAIAPAPLVVDIPFGAKTAR